MAEPITRARLVELIASFSHSPLHHSEHSALTELLARRDAEPLIERTAQLIAHRACHNQEQDTQNGKLAGYCIVCGVPWPCEYAGKPPVIPSSEPPGCPTPAVF